MRTVYAACQFARIDKCRLFDLTTGPRESPHRSRKSAQQCSATPTIEAGQPLIGAIQQCASARTLAGNPFAHGASREPGRGPRVRTLRLGRRVRRRAGGSSTRARDRPRDRAPWSTSPAPRPARAHRWRAAASPPRSASGRGCRETWRDAGRRARLALDTRVDNTRSRSTHMRSSSATAVASAAGPPRCSRSTRKAAPRRPRSSAAKSPDSSATISSSATSSGSRSLARSPSSRSSTACRKAKPVRTRR